MTKKESKEKRTNDILEAAVLEFVEKGYENTSMESLAARAGLTKGGLYYHFSSKDDILIKANELFMEPVMAMIMNAQSKAKASHGLERYINDYLSYWVQHEKALSFIFLSMTKAISNRELWDLYKGYTTPMIQFFEGLYQKGIDGGEFRPLKSSFAAVSLMAALDGIIGYLVIDKDLNLKTTIDSFVATFVDVYKK